MAKVEKYSKLENLIADEDLASSRLKFSIICKNSRVSYHYDLSKIGSNYPSIIQAFSWAIFDSRNSVGHLSRVVSVASIRFFFSFLDDYTAQHNRAISITDIDDLLLSNFAEWLKANNRLQYSTAARHFASITGLFKRISKHPKFNRRIEIPNNLFPNKHRMNNSIEGYSTNQFKNIMKAVANDLRARTNDIEQKYIPKWIEKDPPVEDVIEFDENSPNDKHPSKWRSEKYKIWWWENTCNCERWNTFQLKNVKGGTAFYQSFRKNGESKIKNLNQFYDEIGAGPSYKPQYRGQPCPTFYRSRWQKFDYLHWYWENNFMGRDVREIPKKKFTKLFNSARMFHGGIGTFYEKIGYVHRVTVEDLIPYFIMLLARTALNPSTILGLSIDCLERDPINPERWMIEWTKIRAFKSGKTIPISLQNDIWAPALVKRVIEITSKYRQPDQKNLWLTTLNSWRSGPERTLTPQIIRFALAKFVKRYQLYEELNEGHGEQKLLSIQPRKFRPTIAMMEYVRTEDLIYIQDLLGHTRPSMTAAYINRTGDAILRMRRGLHINALMVGLTDGDSVKLDLMTKMGISSPQTEKILQAGGIHDALLNHCTAPTASPFSGQKKGEICTAGSDCCLSCQNLLITPADIVKYFSYEIYHQKLRDCGALSDEQLEQIFSEKRLIWEQQILPRYSPNLIAKCRQQALENPPPEWTL